MSYQFKYGLEHEVGLIKGVQWLDFSNLEPRMLENVIEQLPRTASDYPGLREGNVGIKSKRWYIEGLERFDEAGTFLGITPKGLEIRTPISNSIDEAVATAWSDRAHLAEILAKYGITIAETSFNPVHTSFIPDPPLNTFELADTEMTQSESAGTYMLTYGPDINISGAHINADAAVDITRKLIAYSAYLVPFSFSSPFYGGELWDGYSVRTWYRSAIRPAALAYLSDSDLDQYKAGPTHLARIPPEAGRIEYKAFDTVGDPELYRGLMALIKGLVIDTTLSQHANQADVELHRLAARHAWDDDTIYAGSVEVLTAARAALASDPDAAYLNILERQLKTRRTPAHEIITRYNRQQHDIIRTLTGDSL